MQRRFKCGSVRWTVCCSVGHRVLNRYWILFASCNYFILYYRALLFLVLFPIISPFFSGLCQWAVIIYVFIDKCEIFHTSVYTFLCILTESCNEIEKQKRLYILIIFQMLFSRSMIESQTFVTVMTPLYVKS